LALCIMALGSVPPAFRRWVSSLLMTGARNAYAKFQLHIHLSPLYLVVVYPVYPKINWGG
jgi:hypothetical protein